MSWDFRGFLMTVCFLGGVCMLFQCLTGDLPTMIGHTNGAIIPWTTPALEGLLGLLLLAYSLWLWFGMRRERPPLID